MTTLEMYEKLLREYPAIDRKGAKTPYTSVNGNMFSFITQEGDLALRLPKEVRESFMAEFKTELCVQHGTVMKEYVLVPIDLLEDIPRMKPHFDASYAYVSSLKPKPTKRKK